jgi:hypothetical protein
MLTRLFIVLVLTTLMAFSTTDGRRGGDAQAGSSVAAQPPDGGRPAVLTGDAASTTPDTNPRTCDSPTLRISLIPEPGRLLVFGNLQGACGLSDGSEVLLQNSSNEAVDIDSVDISTYFTMGAVELPKRLEAGERMPLSLRFVAQGPDEAVGTLVVTSGEQCVSFPINGRIASDIDGVTVYDPLVVDFGHVARGSSSSVREMRIVSTPARGGAFTTTSLSTDTPGTFGIVGTPQNTELGDGCSATRVSLQFFAPPQPGLARGYLIQDFMATTADGQKLAGFSSVDLLGDSD